MMFSLPTLIKELDGTYKFSDGAIVSLPAELRDKHRIGRYSQIQGGGWGTSEFGYSYYSFRLPLGQTAIFPGLYIHEHTKPKKKFAGYVPTLTQRQVEQVALKFSSFLDAEVTSVQGDLAMLVHDLRALSNSIYNPAVEAQRLLDRDEVAEARKRIETVIAAQGILRMRTDALDFSGNALDPNDDSEIQIYKKIDKVQRCFKSMAQNQGKSVTLSGHSFRKIKGQDVFELVPYTIIDNAVKYSPSGYDISVEVFDQGATTAMIVKSYGPKIGDDEKSAIFGKYFRGRAAVESKSPGTGIGLNISAKIIDEIFSGSISVHQKSEYVDIDGLRYHETDFRVTVPSF